MNDCEFMIDKGQMPCFGLYSSEYLFSIATNCAYK